MSDESSEFRNFTQGLARQIKQEEKRRFVRLAIFMTALSVVLLGLLVRMQSNDHHLRELLRDQCIARNEGLDLQRGEYDALVTSPQTPMEQRPIWAKILREMPENRRCEDFLDR